MMQAKVQPGILNISPYQPGKSFVDGQTDILKLSSNENPLGAPVKAITAYRESAHNLNIYPCSDHSALREAIGKKHDLSPDMIVCGAGSDQLIGMLCQAFAGVGDEVIHTRHGFAMYKISTLGVGATPIVAEEKKRHVDVDEILNMVSAQTRLIFIANPANPTGTMIKKQNIVRLMNSLRPDILVILDGAYVEYVEDGDFEEGAGLIDNFPNIVMLRTFSKFYGLGGLRVGWAYGVREIIDVLNRIREPFNLSSGQIAGAIGALADTDFCVRTFKTNLIERVRLRDGLCNLGIEADPSHANFVLARFANSAQAKSANKYLESDGIIVRDVENYALTGGLRITVGDAQMVDRVLASLAIFIQKTTK